MRRVTLAAVLLLSANAPWSLGDELRALQDCPACPEMVVLPAGHFVMGSPESEKERSGDESPMHRVEFARSFAMSRFETRHAEFEAFVKETARQMPPCYRDPQFPRTPDHPVICVSVDDAESYVEWLSAKTGAVYRLPSEAEWEYAVRGQADGAAASVYSFGNDAAQLCANANTRVEFCNDGYPNTAPVGSFPPNAFGLFDMHGNVWEFMADCVTTSYDGAPADGATVREGDCGKRIMRGGGWYNASTGHHRSANRGWLGVQMRDPMTGFRVVREIAGK